MEKELSLIPDDEKLIIGGDLLREERGMVGKEFMKVGAWEKNQG